MTTGIRQTFTMKITDDANRIVATGGANTVGDEEIEFSVDVPAKSGANGENQVDIVIDVSDVQSFYIVANGALTMTENVTPDLTVALSANQPYWWYTGLGSNPFTVDCTYLKFTNATASIITVHGAFLVSA